MKKIFAKLLCVLLTVTLLPMTAFAGQNPSNAPDEEYVTVIVEVAGDAVLEAQNAKELGYKMYLGTDEAKTAEKKVRTAQSKVQAQITDVTKTEGFSYAGERQKEKRRFCHLHPFLKTAGKFMIFEGIKLLFFLL